MGKQSTLAGLWKRVGDMAGHEGGIPVILTGSLTLDIPCIAGPSQVSLGELRDKYESRIGIPMLGGSLPWTYRGFHAVEALPLGRPKNTFQLTYLGPKPKKTVNGKSREEARWKNERFLELAEKEFHELTEADWDVPMSLHVSLPGRHDRYQEDSSLKEEDRERCYRVLYDGRPKVVYLGAAWRGSAPVSQIPDESGWITALHTGSLASGHSALSKIKQSLPHIDLLFTDTATLASLLGISRRLLLPLDSPADGITASEAKRLPPLTVLYQGYHEIAMIARDLGQVYQVQKDADRRRSEFPAPVGLRSCFIGCFLHGFLTACCEHAEITKEGLAGVLGKLLEETAVRSLEVRRRHKDFWAPSCPKFNKIEVKAGAISPYAMMIGRSREKEKLCHQIERVAGTRVPVLITGESGAGKEVVAINIHSQSQTSERFVPLNCGAIPEQLVESELFGHVKGAFTGADAAHTGVFAYAHNGTLFLDEIGLMPKSTQVKILRAIEEDAIFPIGSRTSVQARVRLVCATDQDLEAAVQDGRFLASLYYRISVYRIHVCPLRQKKEDIEPLVGHFARDCREKWEAPEPRFSMEAMEELCRYDWPGNVRELKNVVERCAVETQGDREVTAEDVRMLVYGETWPERRFNREQAEHSAEPLLAACRESMELGVDELGLDELQLLALFVAKPDADYSPKDLNRQFQGALKELKKRGILQTTRPRGGPNARILLDPSLRQKLPD